MSTTPVTDLPQASPDWAYFLDMDGTLIELAETPDGVHVPARLQAILSAVYKHCDGALALVSGRRIDDLDTLLGLPHLSAAGQHGLERRDVDGHNGPTDDMPEWANAVTERLTPLQLRHPGMLLENKGGTLAVHYRQAPALASYLSRVLEEIVSEQADILQLQRGKYVLELKPVGHNKGSAIQEFMTQAPFKGRQPVFIGDDLTDEYGFDKVNHMQGLSIKVGAGKTKAHYRLANVDAVLGWLAAMPAHSERITS